MKELNVLSLCDGMSCGQISLIEEDFIIKQYYASEIDKNAIKVTQDNFPDTIQLGDVMNFVLETGENNEIVLDEEKLKELPKIDLVIFGSPCFTGDTLVLTNNGYQEIKNLQIGDTVISHDNQMHKIIDWANTGKKKIYEIKNMGSELIKTTSNHKFYVRKKYREYNNLDKKTYRLFKDPEWKEVKDLNKDYYVGYAINQESKIPEWNGVEYWKQWRTHIANDIDLTNSDFWYIVGRWLGDGWVRKNRKGKYRNKYNGFIICCAKDEAEYLKERMLKVVKNITVVQERTAVKIQVTSTEIATFLSQFGEGAKNKFIPKFVMDLPIELLKSFLEGYFDADGCKNKQKFCCNTISRNLAYGIGQCVAKVFKRPFTLSKHVTNGIGVIEGRIVNQNPVYKVEFKKEKGKQDKAFYENGYLWLPITYIKETDMFEDTYDITVEDSHSFTANGVIVHNCRSLSKATAGREKYNNGLKGVSWLFYPCNAILQWLKKYNNIHIKFLVENVDSNNKKDLMEMSKCLGVEPIMIDSNLFSAQDRKRNYWTNIPILPLPESCDLVLQDILDTNVEEKFYYKEDFTYHGDDKKVCATLHINGHDILKRVNNKNFKCPTLTSCRGGNHQKKVYENGRCRKLTPNEYRKLQTIPDWYKMNVSNTAIYNMCGDGWTIEVIKHIFKGLKEI